MTSLAITDRNHPVYQAVLLGGACALVSLALIGGYLMTHERIAEQDIQDQLNTLNQVLPASAYDNNPLGTVSAFDHAALNQPVELMTASMDGVLTATAMQLTVAGWGGPLDMVVATTPEGEVMGVRVVRHKETPGLADKIEIAKSDWITTFDGRSLSNTKPSEWAVQKDGGVFDQFTGATITPRAVVRGVHSALQVQQQWQQHKTEDSVP